MKGGLMKTKGTNFRARISIYLLFCALIVFWSLQVFGQEWTAEQKEIWKAVETQWELYKQGDLEGVMALQHDNVFIWWNNKVMPLGKKIMKHHYKDWFDYDKPVAYELEPLVIQIFGNVANVFYSYKWNGKALSDRARGLDTWIKKDNKWLKISYFTASCDELPLCKR